MMVDNTPKHVTSSALTRLLKPATLALLLTIAVTARAQPARPKVLAFFTTGGETDHYLFAQDAMRRLGTNAAAQGYGFTATGDWDALSDAGLKDVRLVIWLNDQPHTDAQRDAFRRYMDGGGAWLGFHISGFSSNAWPWYRNDFLGGGGFMASNWPSLPGRVNVDDPAHATVKNVPATFVAPINEWYSWRPEPARQSGHQVLLTLRQVELPMGVKNTLNGGDILVAWSNTKLPDGLPELRPRRPHLHEPDPGSDDRQHHRLAPRREAVDGLATSGVCRSHFE